MATLNQIQADIARGELLYAQYVSEEINDIFNGSAFIDKKISILYNVLEALSFKVSIGDIGIITQILYALLLTIIGGEQPTPPDVNVSWGYFDADPYNDIIGGAGVAFQFGDSLEIDSESIILDFTSNANGKYLAVKIPVGMNSFNYWSSTQFNNGQIPDQVFRPIITVGGFKYIITSTGNNFFEPQKEKITLSYAI